VRAARRCSISCSHLYPDSQRTMGWDVDSTGFRLVAIAPTVPKVVEKYLGDDVTEISLQLMT